MFLESCSGGKLVVLGIGNHLRGDDAFGPLLIERMQSEALRDTVCLDAGSTPENYIGPVVRERPDAVLIVDVVHLGEPAGTMAILDADEIIRSGMTTHDLSPAMFLEQLACRLDEEVRIAMLGVQPESLEFGAEIGPDVADALGVAVEALLQFRRR